MAITNITSGLTSFNPVYNPLVYMFDSTNKSNDGFRYIVDIYSAGTSTKIFEARVAPRPTDGFGYIDVSKVISDYITYDIDVTSTTSIDAINSHFEYDVKIGEEFVIDWDVDDTFFQGGVVGAEILVSGGTPNTFATGDQVVISQDVQLIPALEGLHTVFSAVTNQSFLVGGVTFIATSANTGTVRYADNRKTIFRDELEYTAQTAYNAAFSASEWIDYDSTEYKLQSPSTTNKILTNIPDNFRCSESQDLFVNSSLDSVTGATFFVFENDGGDILFKSAVSNYDINQTAVGPNNLGTLTINTGTAPLIKSNTLYYDFSIYEGASAITKTYRVYIDRTCAIEDYEILFLDRKGSFSSFSFPLRANTNIRGRRTTYNQQIGDVAAGKWTYDRTDSGEVISNVNISEEITLRTNTITNEMAIYFQELVFSPVTFVKIDGVYHSCVINTNSYSPQSLKNKKLIRESVTIRLSNQNNINI
ncbi:hypothetical protein KAU11_10020 [Candidatus Babeliales bacterium]|nr:hypothetical protein [Candidatus Babeliales bacterium]